MKNIYKALAQFQQSCPIILKDTQGYGYVYTDLPDIYKVIMPLLKDNGLGFTQILKDKGLETILFHIESGETISGYVEIPSEVSLAKMNPYQVMGSAYTYFRRYALSSMLGIVTDKDTDAIGEQVAKQVSQTVAQTAVDKRLLEIKELAKEKGFTGTDMKAFQIWIFAKTTHSLKEDNYDLIIDNLKKLK